MPDQYPQSAFDSPNGFVAFIKHVVTTVFSLNFLGGIYVIFSLLIIALITLVLYCLVRLYEIRQTDAKQKAATILPNTVASTVPGAAPATASTTVTNTTWNTIREHLLSDNASDWKLGVIEADIYMDKVLDDSGFHGDTTGDKLKQVTPDKLPSISIAWEMHKVRNRIAHDGAAFVLTMPEARRMLAFYEMIFSDLRVI